MGWKDAPEVSGWQSAPVVEDQGSVKSFAAGLGAGFGRTVLGAQKLAGMGMQKAGELLTPDETTTKTLVTGQKSRGLIQRGGDWLVNDADAGRAKLLKELQPYSDANPFTAGAGRIGGEVVATLPVGGWLAKGASKVPGLAAAAPNFINAIRTAGMQGGSMPVRMAGGAITGGASAAMVDHEQAGTGAAFGAALPPVLKSAGVAGAYVGSKLSEAKDAVAERLMQSALKPTIAQLRNGEAATAIKTLLDYGISPTEKGVEQLKDLIRSKNADIANAISGSSAIVDRVNVLNALSGVKSKFAAQVSPTADMNAIQKVADDFTGSQAANIPVQLAQELKQGTYRVLKGKYGQMGSAETEAQKALARGLKEEISNAVPAVGPLNAEESRLLSTLTVAERRALMSMNNNPMGLSLMAKNPFTWAAFMADRSTAFKALAARMVNRAGSVIPNVPAIPSGAEALTYRAAPVLAADH